LNYNNGSVADKRAGLSMRACLFGCRRFDSSSLDWLLTAAPFALLNKLSHKHAAASKRAEAFAAVAVISVRTAANFPATDLQLRRDDCKRGLLQ